MTTPADVKGARYGQLRDPFGVVWALNQQIQQNS